MSIQRRDRDLLIIVIAEVFVYIITITSYPSILLEMMIRQYSQIENLLPTIAILLLFISFATPFYIYLISSKSFRRDFRKLIINMYRKLRRQPIIPVVPQRIHHRKIKMLF